VIDFEKAKVFFKKADPVLFAYSKKVSTLAVPSKAASSSYVFHLYSSIISQQISVKAADAILQRFLSLVGNPYDPVCVLAHDIEDFRAIGLSRQKASYIRSIAELTQNGTVHIDHLDDLSDAEVIAELVKIKGVGQWTAEMFLMLTLARPDVFSVGDLGLLNAAKKLYNTPDMTKEELLHLSETWSPHRTTAALLLWHSLDNKPTL
jgi:DNA-3-methyladenine glycosylase II